ncbi:MAG: hypothetical protein ACFCUM_15460 [Bacteroidales bacterium]
MKTIITVFRILTLKTPLWFSFLALITMPEKTFTQELESGVSAGRDLQSGTEEVVSGEVSKATESPQDRKVTVQFDERNGYQNSGNSHAEEFRRQTEKSYEEAWKALNNYPETFSETMGMVEEELRKWQGNYAYEYNETMGKVQEEMRKYGGPAMPEGSTGKLVLPGQRRPGNRFGTEGLRGLNRYRERDAILGPWELPEAPPPFHKFQPDLQPSF